MKNIPHRENRVPKIAEAEGIRECLRKKEAHVKLEWGWWRQKPSQEEMEEESPKLSRDLVRPSSPASPGLRWEQSPEASMGVGASCDVRGSRGERECLRQGFGAQDCPPREASSPGQY